jgi:tRNA U54 and U55 pseudouridine synthase Pus10
MAATAFVTVVRDRLADHGDDTAKEMLHSSEVNRLTAERFEHRRVEELANLQYETTKLGRELREEMQKLRAEIRLDLAERSADSMKWALLFWVGQAVAVAGIVSALR